MLIVARITRVNFFNKTTLRDKIIENVKVEVSFILNYLNVRSNLPDPITARAHEMVTKGIISVTCM